MHKAKNVLKGIAKNIIRNKYRKTNLNFSISDYEERLIDSINIENNAEESEQNDIIKNTLETLKEDEYNIFIMFYYSGKTIKEIAEKLECSNGKVKVTLHRVRKLIKKNLEDGGYGYGK